MGIRVLSKVTLKTTKVDIKNDHVFFSFDIIFSKHPSQTQHQNLHFEVE